MIDLQSAIGIAVKAHQGQTDKGGNPYILHPLRVMLSLETEKEQIVGVLHDVVEDCADRGYDWEYLQAAGCTQEILDALYAVTKTKEEDNRLKLSDGEDRILAYLDFVARAKANKIGARVKRADLIDNLDVTRIGDLQTKDLNRLNQYKRAILLLDS